MGERHAVRAAGTALFLALLVVPVAWFLARAAGSGGVLPVLRSPATWRIAGLSLAQAFLSALLSVILGLPGAWLLARRRFPLRRLVRALTLVPFALPSIIVVLALVSFWGRAGVVGRLTGGEGALVYSFGGILLGHVFYNVSLVLRVVGQGWGALDPRLEETARCLGQRPAGVFLRVTLPLLAPHIALSFSLVFLYCFLSFGVVLVFGGIRWSTLEVMIYRSLTVSLDPGAAVAYAGLQLALSLGFLALSNRWIGRRQGARRAALPSRSVGTGGPAVRILTALYLLFLLTLLVGPLVTLVLRALSPPALQGLLTGRIGGRDVSGILRADLGQVVGGSVLLAAGAGGLAFVGALVAALAARRRPGGLSDLVFQVPVGLSTVTLAVGVDLLISDLTTHAPPRGLLVGMVQALVAFPVVYRILRTEVAGLSARYGEAAATLGSPPLARVLSIDLPLLRRGLLNGLAYGLAVAFSDFTVAMTVGRGDVVTFPVAIYRLIGFRSFDLGLALGLVYLVLCAVLFAIIDGSERREPRHG